MQICINRFTALFIQITNRYDSNFTKVQYSYCAAIKLTYCK